MLYLCPAWARFCAAFFLLIFSLTAPGLLAQKSITLEDIWQNGTFSAKGVPGFNFQRDGVHFTKLSGSTLEQYDLRTGDRSAVLLDASTIGNTEADWKGRFDGYSFSRDESKLLLAVGTESIFRWSTKARYFVYDFGTKKIAALHSGPKQCYATFSPDGSKVAFVVENDLYYKDLMSGQTTRVTQDGQVNAVINGASDWVYEEEFELVRAFEWSPDGQRLAYLRFDERAVPEISIEMYRDSAYPQWLTFKYPKVGEPNATVSAHIYELPTRKTRAIQLPDSGGSTPADTYLPRITWTPAGQLCLTWLNRHQNHLRLLLADPATGQCTTLLEETNKYYLDLHDISFLADGSGFVMQSEKSGFNHLYRYDMSGREVAALTQGKFDVTAFYGLDEKNGLAYYQAAAKNPMQRELYSVKLSGKGQKKISKEAGTHSAQHSSTFDYYVDTYSTLNSPPRYTVRSRKGKILRELEQNQALAAKQQEYGTIPAEFLRIPVPATTTGESPQVTSGGELSLNAFLIRPTAPQFQGKKLPVLMFVYGGPGSQQVLDQWKGANYWWFQMLAQQGCVVACVDNRGTGGRGEAFKKMTYQQLGHIETQDQIAAARHLATLPFVDQNRIGIFGWSYGGYMSSLCMLKGADVFKAGIAVAPVTNWKWYDSVYTERYMRTHEENPEGYEQNSPTNFADRLRGNYLLVHGLADDNVHFQHSAEMANKLIAANKQFDTMTYPNRHHGISGDGARLHLYTLMTNFLNEKLKG